MWKKINYEIQGRGHEKEDIPCQDKTYAISVNGVHCMALADGAGSAKLSHIGAEVAVKAAAHYICDNFEKALADEDGKETKMEFVSTVYMALEMTANELDCDIKDLASTLMLVAIKNDYYILFHIGDGIVGALKDDSVNVISWPTNGEFAGSTVFTTSRDALNYLVAKKQRLEDIEGFILMSDGTGDSFYDKNRKELVSSTKNFFEYLKAETEEDMKDIIDCTFREVISKKTYDDCSICLILVGEEEGPEAYKLTFEALCNRFGVNPNPYVKSKKRVKRYSMIINYVKEPRTLKEISNKLKLKPKYAKKVIDRLIEKEAIVIDGIYYTINPEYSLEIE